MADAGLSEGIIRTLGRHRGERHMVALQDYPDPDAISSAAAHQRLSLDFDIQTDLVYAGELSHHQNRSLVDALGVELRHPRQGYRVDAVDGAVFVDNQGTTCDYLVRRLRRAAVPAVLVVDHHEGEPLLNPEQRVVEEVGATATIYVELLQDGTWRLDPTWRPDRMMASGLLLGILTDTRGLTQATRRDHVAASWLAPMGELDFLEDITHQAIPWESMEIIRRVMATRLNSRGFVFAGIGYLHATHRDTIPEAATMLLEQEGVHTSLVFGIVRDWRLRETLTGSVRTMLSWLSPKQFLESAIGPIAGKGTTFGGRAFAGGFEIPIGMSSRMASQSYQCARWLYYEQLLLERLVGSSKLGSLVGIEGKPPLSSPDRGGPSLGDPPFDPNSPAWRVISRLGDVG